MTTNSIFVIVCVAIMLLFVNANTNVCLLAECASRPHNRAGNWKRTAWFFRERGNCTGRKKWWRDKNRMVNGRRTKRWHPTSTVSIADFIYQRLSPIAAKVADRNYEPHVSRISPCCRERTGREATGIPLHLASAPWLCYLVWFTGWPLLPRDRQKLN